MNTSLDVLDASLLAVLEDPAGKLNRKGFPMLAHTLDKKYAAPGTHVVRWLPGTETVGLSDGSTVEKFSSNC